MPQSSPPAQFFALVPCAGSGSRAGEGLPKQYRQVGGSALVLHCLAAFAQVPRIARSLVVVAPGDDFFADYQGPLALSVAAVGGSTRAASVRNGLGRLLADGAHSDDWVLVHDAARCLITAQLIERLMDACINDPVGGLLAVPLPDTLKSEHLGRVAATIDRQHKWLAQTPQMFRIGALAQALDAAGNAVTDEASAMELAGNQPLLVPGDALNFKVTYAEDFALAHTVLTARAASVHSQTTNSAYDYP